MSVKAEYFNYSDKLVCCLTNENGLDFISEVNITDYDSEESAIAAALDKATDSAVSYEKTKFEER
ncbi:hypothetical protein [Raoultella sp. HC6]|uniref:hypothetical protein n=1 Tax=Raoultella sp. HC6 TaxID=2923366 RepID=UPI001F50EE20|nr:hypothetical protein [Raoultella sp. HC6]